MDTSVTALPTNQTIVGGGIVMNIKAVTLDGTEYPLEITLGQLSLELNFEEYVKAMAYLVAQVFQAVYDGIRMFVKGEYGNMLANKATWSYSRDGSGFDVIIINASPSLIEKIGDIIAYVSEMSYEAYAKCAILKLSKGFNFDPFTTQRLTSGFGRDALFDYMQGQYGQQGYLRIFAHNKLVFQQGRM